MKRKHFFLISAVIAGLYGCMMLFMPHQFTLGMMVEPPSPVVDAWARFLSVNLIAIAWINFAARRSPWSPAVRGILVGDLLLHLLALVTDWYAYTQNIVNLQGVIQGSIVHLLFVFGAGYFAFSARARDAEQQPTAAASVAI